MVLYTSSAVLHPISSFKAVQMNHEQNFSQACWVMMDFQSCFELAVEMLNKTISKGMICCSVYTFGTQQLHRLCPESRGPLSMVMVDGTPNQAIHTLTNA